MSKKMCPILTAGWFGNKYASGITMRSNPMLCYEEKCALYDEEYHRCSLGVDHERRSHSRRI